MSGSGVSLADHYMVRGEPVELRASQEFIAFEVEEGELASVVEENPNAALGVRQGARAILLVRRTSALAETMSATGAHSLPVYDVDGLQVVLVNEFIVRFAEDTRERYARALIARYGGRVIDELSDIERQRYVVEFDRPEVAGLDSLDGLADERGVRYATPNFVNVNIPPEERATPESGQLSGTMSTVCDAADVPAGWPNDERFVLQWAFDNQGSPGVVDADVDGPEAWALTTGSKDVAIAVLDVGVDGIHEDLKGKLADAFDATGGGDPDPGTDQTHGTAAAGVAAAQTNNVSGVAGMSWDSEILSIKVGSAVSGGDGAWSSSVLDIQSGLDLAITHGAEIVSNSWYAAESVEITDSVTNVVAAGILVVNAAGQDTLTVAYPGRLADAGTYPAIGDSIVTVSATNQWDEFKTSATQDRTLFPREGWTSNSGPAITLAAPGVRLCTTDLDQKYLFFSGTSAAAPLVAGAAALLLAVRPTGSPSEVKDWLQKGAYDVNGDGLDPMYGAGRLNAHQALVAALGDELAVTISLADGDNVLRSGEEMDVKVVVTASGNPVPNANVWLRAKDTNLLTVHPHLLKTDGEGAVRATIEGESWSWSTTTEVSAEFADVAGTAQVEVGLSGYFY